MPRFFALLPGLLLLLLVISTCAAPGEVPAQLGLPDLFEALGPSAAGTLKAELRKADPETEGTARELIKQGDLGGAVAALKTAGLDISDEVIDTATNLKTSDAGTTVAAPDVAELPKTEEGTVKEVTEKDSGAKKGEKGDDNEDSFLTPLEKQKRREEDDDDKARCFPAAATVERPDGTRVRMDELRVGDSVRIAPGAHDNAFSEVFLFTHADPVYSSGRFVRVSAGAEVLTAAPGHFVYKVGEGGSGRAAVTVESLGVGDRVLVNGEDVAVKKVKRIQGNGLYNPQTLHGDVVVEGFLATTYTSAVVPQVAHALLAPARAAYSSGGLDFSAAFEVCAGYAR